MENEFDLIWFDCDLNAALSGDGRFYTDNKLYRSTDKGMSSK